MISFEQVKTACSDIEKFKAYIPNPDTLIVLAKQYPSLADNLIQPLLTDLTEFQRLVWNPDYLLAIVKQFPNHCEALIQPLLTNSAEFKRLVWNESYLKAIAKQFPGHENILGKPTVNEAFQEVTNREANKKEIINNAHLLSQEKNNQNSFFTYLPNPILTHIASFTSNTSYHSQEEAEKIAVENFSLSL